MSWIMDRLGNGLSEVDADNLKEFYEEVLALEIGGEASDILKYLRDTTSKDGVRQLAQKFLDQSECKEHKEYKEYAFLFKTMGALESNPGVNSRRIGWGNKFINKNFTPDEFNINLTASGEARFTVKESKPDDEDVTANARMKLTGELKGNVAAGLAIKSLNVSGNAESNLSRELHYLMQYAENKPAGLALVDTLKRIAKRPDKLDQVAEAFFTDLPSAPEPPPLQMIELKGAQGFGLKADAEVIIPSGNYGTPRIFGSGDLSFSKSFKMEIKPDGNKLELKGSTTASEKKGYEIGIGYNVGISSLNPEFAKEIAGLLTGTDELINTIDSVLEEYGLDLDEHTLIKPGTALTTLLMDEIKKVVDKDDDISLALLEFIKGALGTGDSSSTDELASLGAEFLAGELDNLTDLFGTISNAGIFQKWLLNLENQDKINGALEKGLKKVFSAAQDELKKLISKVADELENGASHLLDVLTQVVGDLENTVNKVYSFLCLARERLDSIAKALADTNADLLAVEIAWRRRKERSDTYSFRAILDPQDENAQKAYHKTIWNPQKGLQAMEAAGSGVKIKNNLASEVEKRELGRRWGVSVLNFKANTDRSLICDMKVERSSAGITVGTDSFLRKSRTTFEAERKMEIANFLSVGLENSARLNVTLAQDENFTEEEITKWLDAFKTGGAVTGHGARDEILKEFRKDVDSDGSLDLTLSAMLAVPTEVAVEVLENVNGNEQKMREVINKVLFSREDIKKEIEETLKEIVSEGSIITAEEIIADSPGIALNGSGDVVIEDPSLVLPRGDDLIEKLFDKYDSCCSDDVMEDYYFKEDFDNLNTSLRNFYDARENMVAYFLALSRTREEVKRKIADNVFSEEEREELFDREKSEMKLMRNHWMDIGLPWFNSFGVPELFSVLTFTCMGRVIQALTKDEVMPPVIFRYKPDGKAMRLFLTDQAP